MLLKFSNAKKKKHKQTYKNITLYDYLTSVRTSFISLYFCGKKKSRTTKVKKTRP